MTLSLNDYDDFCKDVSTINEVLAEALDKKRSIFKWFSKEIKAIFKEYVGIAPTNVHFSGDGSYIEVIYNMNNFNEQNLPLSKDLVEALFMPVKIKLIDSSKLVFVLLPQVDVFVEVK